ncbi:MAG: hypothetical protein KC646_01650 [Candidatus Cloacimonetes bacterium]|nr:hypothetical protein [Candidatus Cloacimonadota bacterium]
MKIILCVLIGIISVLYLSSLKRSSETFQYLTTGRIEIEGLEIVSPETSGQFYFFLYLVFAFNISIWLGAYHLHFKNLAIVGAILSFIDFIANNEVYNHLKTTTYTESSASWIMRLFYLIISAILACLLLLFINLI